MIAVLGGLGAAVLWATSTLCSSRSSRMLGSRVVLGWIMIVGVVVGLPIAIASPPPATMELSTVALLVFGGSCYVIGLQATYAALRIGKVSIVAPIVSTEGAVAAGLSIVLGDPVGLAAGLVLVAIAVGVVLSSLERDHAVPAGDFGVLPDALDDPSTEGHARTRDGVDTRRAILLSVIAAAVFGVGLVAAGRAAVLVPVAWVALAARLVGIVGVVLPLLLQRRLRLTRAALPLVVIAGIAEIVGSMASAWGSRESIAIAAVMGSQFAALAAVAAFVLFKERLGRIQLAGVVLIVIGVTALAWVSA